MAAAPAGAAPKEAGNMAEKMLPIKDVAARFGIAEAELYYYGPYKAKLEPSLAQRLTRCQSCGRQVLVTATTPTPAGEGKTTTAIGLSMALNRLGVKSIVTLREPSLGPVSASRAARPAAAPRRSTRCGTSTCISPATSTPSPPPTTCCRP